MTDTWTWATVTQASPLRIKVDGDAAELNATTDDLVGSLAVDDRVRVHLHADGIIVVGRMEGLGPIAQFGTYSIAPTVDPFLSVINGGSQSTLHVTSSAGFSGPYLIGIGNDAEGQAGLLISNKAQGVGFFLSQEATVSAAWAYGMDVHQVSTVAPATRFYQNATGAAEVLQIVAVGTPTTSQNLVVVKDPDSDAGFVRAKTGVIDWRRDVRIQPNSTPSTARLVVVSYQGKPEATFHRMFVEDKTITFLTGTGSTNIKYPRRILSGNGLQFQTAPNLTLTDAAAEGELPATLSGITWTTQIEAQHNKVGFFGVSPALRQYVGGSRGGNAALAGLLTGLDNLGLINNGTTA